MPGGEKVRVFGTPEAPGPSSTRRTKPGAKEAERLAFANASRARDQRAHEEAAILDYSIPPSSVSSTIAGVCPVQDIATTMKYIDVSETQERDAIASVVGALLPRSGQHRGSSRASRSNCLV
jgi:hypothetical protein